MKILITGANGQLGSELRRCFNIGQTELGRIPMELSEADITHIDIDQLDIVKLNQVKEFVLELKPDVIINCAAFTNVNACETNQDAAFKANSFGPRNLAVAASEVKAKLVHISTDYVFAGDSSTPYSEWDICNPQSIYGHTKHLGEIYVQQFCRESFILRTSWLYGYVGSNFVKTILKLARENGNVKVVNDQFGNPTNAADVSHHILKLIVTGEYGIYHCTNNETCTWYDFACEFLRLSGIECNIHPCTTDEFPTPAKRPAYSSLNNRMLRCTVGDDMRTWQDAIKSYMSHYDKETGEISV